MWIYFRPLDPDEQVLVYGLSASVCHKPGQSANSVFVCKSVSWVVNACLITATNNVDRFCCKISSFRQSRNNLNMFSLFRLCRKDEVSFDNVADFGNIVAETSNIVAKNGNNVEATCDIVERIVQLAAFGNVASTLLLVLTGLYGLTPISHLRFCRAALLRDVVAVCNRAYRTLELCRISNNWSTCLCDKVSACTQLRRAIKLRDKVARQNRRCDIGLSKSKLICN